MADKRKLQGTRDCPLPVGPRARSPWNSLGTCCLGRMLTAFLPPWPGEIDRCLKKVSEGVEQFEDIWQKVLGSDTKIWVSREGSTERGSGCLGVNQGEGMLRTSEKQL